MENFFDDTAAKNKFDKNLGDFTNKV